MKFTEKQMKEIEEVVSFTEDGKMNVKGVTGDVEGNVLGDVKGNVKGNVWSDVEGNVGGNVKVDVVGNVGGNVYGNVEGDVGYVLGNVWGNVEGNVRGNVKGSVLGNVNGSVKGNVLGDVEGSVWGYVLGDVGGNVKCTDLTKNTTPFCLLSKEDQERFKSWPHGLCVYDYSQKKWVDIIPHPSPNIRTRFPPFSLSVVYRTRPAPIDTTRTVAIDGMEFKITYEEGGTNPKIERKESK